MPPVAFDFLGLVAGPRAQTELPTHIDLGHRQQRRAGLDGKVEEPRRSVKYEDIYLKDYERVDDLYNGLEKYFQFYNQERRHQALDYRTPNDLYQASLDLSL